MAGLVEPPAAHAVQHDPLYGTGIIGNRAEVITLGSDSAGALPLGLHAFDQGALALRDALDLPAGSFGGFTNGLVAYWSFDTDMNATYGGAAFDARTGPYSAGGVTIDPAGGRFGGAALFDRDSLEYLVARQAVITPGQDFTYSVWYRSRQVSLGGNHTVRHFLLESTGPWTLGAKTDFSTGSVPNAVAFGDLNGDARMDMVVTNMTSNTVSVRLGNGAGGFGARTDFTTGTTPRTVAIGDLNGDGDLDLVTANSGSSTVSVLLGNGAGGFGASADFPTGSNPRSVVMGDVNGDGDLDVAVACVNSSNVSVLLGNGTGSLGAKTDYATGANPYSVSIGDLNGDGHFDLATANLNGHSVSVLLGDGAGGFGSRTDFPTGGSPVSVAMGDLNGDGHLDVVAADYYANAISVLLGNGTGSLGANTDYATGTNPWSVAIGDLNDDGHLDVAAANQGSNTVSVLLGDGAGSFGTKSDYATGTNPTSVALGRLNADDYFDLAVVNQDVNTVSVRLGVESVAYSASYGLRDVIDDGADVRGEVATQWAGGSQSMSYTNGLANSMDRWHHAVVTYSAASTQMTLSIDGVSRGSRATNGSLLETAGLVIGGHRDGIGMNWNGWIDDVAFWNRVLSDAEIDQLQSRAVLGPWPQFRQIEIASGDLDGNFRDDAVVAYSRETGGAGAQQLWIGVPAIHADGSLNWDPASMTLTLLDSLAVPAASSLSPGALRLVAGNFDDDARSEFAVFYLGDDLQLHASSFDVDSATRVLTGFRILPLASGAPTAGLLKDSARLSLSAGDLDGDGVDEIVAVHVDTLANGGALDAHQAVEVFRLETGAWVSKATANGVGWPMGAWDLKSTSAILAAYCNGNQLDQYVLSSGVGSYRSGPLTQPFIALAGAFRNWNENQTFVYDGSMWLFRVVAPPVGGWSIVHDQRVDLANLTSPVQSTWQSTGPSLGLAVGDLNFDGTDEIVLAATDSVRVYDVTTTAVGQPLHAGMVAHYPKTSRLTDASHGIVRIDDLDASPDEVSPLNWQPEILLQEWSAATAPAHLRTRVLRPQLLMNAVGEDTSWTVAGVQPVCDLDHGSITEPGAPYAVSCADLDGDALRIGPYTSHQSVASVMPIVILNAPPVLLDITPLPPPGPSQPDTVDLSGCYLSGAGCEFFATYEWGQTRTLTTQTRFKPGWGFDEGIAAAPQGIASSAEWLGEGWYNKAKKWIDKNLKTKFGRNFSYDSTVTRTVQVATVSNASMGTDGIITTRTLWDVYEYAILGPGGTVGYLSVVVPQAPEPPQEWSPRTWMNNYGSARNDAYRLDHECGNLLSYPSDADLDIGASELFKAMTYQIQEGSGGHPDEFRFSATDFTSATAETTTNSGLLVGKLVDAASNMLNLTGRYTSECENVVTTSLETQVSIVASFGDNVSNRPQWEHWVTPKLFWRRGALVLDYAVRVTGGAGAEWGARYGNLPDPGFLLPRRYDGLTSPGWNGAQLHQSPSVAVEAPSISDNKPYASVGQTVTISADVRNFSLKGSTGPQVQFYLWEEGWASAVVIGTATADSLPPRGRATVSVPWTVPSWAGSNLRLYAQVDPPDGTHPAGLITEIHENNNIGYTELNTDGDGSGPPVVDVPTIPWVPAAFALKQNAPNPFNGSTLIEFALPENGRATLRVYDVMGRVVRTLANGAFPAGFHRLNWDGSSDEGQKAARGVYFYRLESGSFVATRKLILLD